MLDIDRWLPAKEEMNRRILDEGNFVRAVLSGRRRNFYPSAERIDIKPIRVKDKFLLQIQLTMEIHVTTENFQASEVLKLNLLEQGFANFLIETREESFEVRIGKRGQVFQKVSRGNFIPNYEHDRKKRRILDESDPFLKAVGISDFFGKVKPSMRDKYLQVEEFLKILEKTVEKIIENKKEFRLVDLGCGHAYLTFAAFRYFQLKNRIVTFVGVDQRESSRIRNEKISRDLGIADNVQFIALDIASFNEENFDIAIALHACDVATDDALAWAVNNNVEIILASPCCHHDLHSQVKEFPDDVKILSNDGILANRQLDVLTDELRAQILRVMGYRTDVFEFISGDHTSRNLMIRSILAERSKKTGELGEYRHTCKAWGVKPALETRLTPGTFPESD